MTVRDRGVKKVDFERDVILQCPLMESHTAHIAIKPQVIRNRAQYDSYTIDSGTTK